MFVPSRFARWIAAVPRPTCPVHFSAYQIQRDVGRVSPGSDEVFDVCSIQVRTLNFTGIPSRTSSCLNHKFCPHPHLFWMVIVAIKGSRKSNGGISDTVGDRMCAHYCCRVYL